VTTPILDSGMAELHRKWGWLLALGILMIILGGVALAIIPATTLGTSIILGWLLVVSGIFEFVHGFQVRGSVSIFLHLVGGALGVLIGLLVVTHPVAGALVWTLLFASFLTVIGIFRIIAAAQLKFPHWGWAVFDGVITLALGLMVWAGWPSSAVWFLGLAVGVSLLVRGWTYVMIAVALRRLRPITDQPQVRGAA
jgi:uncharacterized membrane protein HdeD (DUF308 family)